LPLLREFIVGALHNEMGLSASIDPDLLAASSGGRVVTPSGMVLDGSKDKISPPAAPDPVNGNEVDPAIVDHLEFYLLNLLQAGSRYSDRGHQSRSLDLQQNRLRFLPRSCTDHQP
jgi:hypothetical protein